VLADWPTGCWEVARSGCCNFSVTSQLYLRWRREGQEQTQRFRCISYSLLAYGLKIPPAKNNALHYNKLKSRRKYFHEILMGMVSGNSVYCK